MAHVYLPAFTVAEWGGLHEYALASTRSLLRAGHEVTAAVSGTLLARRLADAGAEVHEVDWHNYGPYERRFLSGSVRPDLVFAQPQASRSLGLAVAEKLDIPAYVLIHGFYADQASRWHALTQGVGGVSGRLVDLLTGYANVPAWKVSCVPNGIDDEYFNMDIEPYSSDELRITVASRLEPDKIRQLDVLRRVARALQVLAPGRRIVVRMLGDGTARERFERELKGLAGVDVIFTGWLDPADVAREFRGALVTIGAGRAAALSLAVGTPCVAVGKYCNVGLQTDENLQVGLWTNFGDYPLGRHWVSPKSLEQQLAMCLSEPARRTVAKSARDRIGHLRRQSVVDHALFGFLGIA